MNYCHTCKTIVTNKWAIIGGKHVGCKNASSMSKKCSKCKEKKHLGEFQKNRSTTDGLAFYCKPCSNATNKIRTRSKLGLICRIYSSQRQKSKRRGHAMPNYTLSELREFAFNQPNFEELYTNWVNSGYETDLKPSFDRIDDYKPYALDNIRLTTWIKNNKRANEDRKNGTNNKVSRAIKQFTLSGELIQEHHSASSASRVTGVNRGNIWDAARSKGKTAGGFKWKHSRGMSQ